MCLQCLTAPHVFNKRLGKFALMKATKNAYEGDTTDNWKKDEYGLVSCNDPTFRFTSEPLPVKDSWVDKDYDVPEDEDDAFWAAWDRALMIESEILQNGVDLNSLKLLSDEIGFTDGNKQRGTFLLMKRLHEVISAGFKTDAAILQEIREEMANEGERVDGVTE